MTAMENSSSLNQESNSDAGDSRNPMPVQSDISLEITLEQLSFTEPSPKSAPKPRKVSRKVVLKPGHALTHWVERIKSGEDMTGLGGNSNTCVITMEELRRHNKDNDLWVAIRGKVYNVTKYLDYHPGGVEILVAEGGKDATLLFDENHRWVNIDRLLAPCQVGILKTFSLNT